AIVVREDTSGIQTLSDLRGKRVGVMRGDNAEEFMRRGDYGVELFATPTFSDAFHALAARGCDAVVVQRLVAIRIMSETRLKGLRIVNAPIQGFSQQFCFAVKKGGSETLALLNEGLALAVADGTHRRLHAKWFAALELPSNRPIIIGGDHNYPPFEYLDSHGRPQGFTVELTRAIAREVGIDVRVRLAPWPQTVEALRNNEIDAIQGMFYSHEREKVLDFSPRYHVVHCVSVMRKKSGKPPVAFADLAGRDLVIQAEDAILDELRSRNIEANITTVASQEDVVRAVAEGRHACGLATRQNALYFIKKHGWQNLVLGNQTFYAADYCYAVPNGHQALLAQFSEGLAAVRASGEYQQIYDRWLSVYEQTAAGWRSAFKYVFYVAMPLLLVALLAMAWSWNLRQQVAARTADLRKVIKALAESEHKHRLLAEQTLDMIWAMNTDLIFTYANPATENLTGYKPEEFVGTHLSKHFDETHLSELTRIITQEIAKGPNNSGVIFESHILHQNGAPVPIEVHGRVIFNAAGEPVLLQGTTRDISERLRVKKEYESLQTQIAQMQKLDSIGRLAGGVAHDFNNLLMGIMGYTELCREMIADNLPARELLDDVLREVKRSADLTRQLLAFARRQTVAPKVIALNGSVANMLTMLPRLIGEDIDLVWLPADNLWPVKIDPSQVDQILTNLCVNAREAIAGTGKITIETANVAISTDYCQQHAETEPGDYVMLAVSDDGCGMDQETISNIFEPFYTRKTVREGTGLGLATVYGIVRQNNGFINVYSEPDKGTTFRIYLPVTTDAPGMQTEPDLNTENIRGSETILLVEDEKSIRESMCRFLVQLGYNVIPAESPDTALLLAADHQHLIDLLVTDVVMPGMNGRELSERLRTDHAALRCLYMSGYTANVIAHRGILEENVNFLSKPVSLNALARKVREILDQETP
ncbi:MAG: transporter substrate-binding domain-containing protein, partial [Kiritimatiellae bacterium]|nr:transporter substrate-binding domain-containing protein [Kiritimatiellia bacterium]